MSRWARIEFLADVTPDDPGHLIAIEFDNGICDLDLAHYFDLFHLSV